LRIDICHDISLDKWIAERHYLHSTPAGAKVRMWFKDDNGNTIGAMMWGRPSARMLDQNKMLELTRMFFIDDTERFVESKALSKAREHIRKHFPQVKGLIAYSSCGQRHEGTIYEADNWFSVGTTKGHSWKSKVKAERADIDISDKIRWVRTP
jgi:hypothetical protein